MNKLMDIKLQKKINILFRNSKLAFIKVEKIVSNLILVQVIKENYFIPIIFI